MSLSLGVAIVLVLAGFRPLAFSLSAIGAVANAFFIASMLQQRHTRRVALLIGVSVTVSLTVSLVLQDEPGSPSSSTRLAVGAASYLWGATAFGGYGIRLRKRHVLGLASAMEVVAFLLLACGELSLGVAFSVRAVGEAANIPSAEIAAVQLPIAVVGALCGAGALAPPVWLRRRLEPEAPSRAA